MNKESYWQPKVCDTAMIYILVFFTRLIKGSSVFMLNCEIGPSLKTHNIQVQNCTNFVDVECFVLLNGLSLDQLQNNVAF